MLIAQLLSDTKILGELVRVHRQALKEWLDLMPRDVARLGLVDFEPHVVEALRAHASMLLEQVSILGSDLANVLLHAFLVDLHVLRVLRVESFLHEVLQLFILLLLALFVCLFSLVNEVEHLDALFVTSDDLRLGSLHEVLNAVLNRSLDLEVTVDSHGLLADLPEAENV